MFIENSIHDSTSQLNSSRVGYDIVVEQASNRNTLDTQRSNQQEENPPKKTTTAVTVSKG
jgi:hypothetical protein